MEDENDSFQQFEAGLTGDIMWQLRQWTYPKILRQFRSPANEAAVPY